MTPAERLAKLPGCWRPGMLGVFAPGAGQVGWIRILRVGPDGAVYSWVDDGGWIGTATDGEADLSEYVLDLTDPATVGCLAAWCREVCGMPMYASTDDGRWYVSALYPDGASVWGMSPAWRVVTEDHDTEGEAWAAALLDKLEAP